MVTMTTDRNLGYALGATDFLTKPVARAQLVALLDRHAGGSGERHALVVDDKTENREVLRRVLGNEGWRVSEAENGLLALEEVAKDPPALILLDLLMPVMDGFEFVLEMRRRDPARQIPIVVVTAKDITEEDRRRLNGGVMGLIEREGLDQDALVEMIREQAAATASRAG
jgi:CheY-like chemotaxis protein